MRRLRGLLFLAAMIGGCADSPDVPTYGALDQGPAFVLANADGASPYSGVGRLRGRAQCTAALIETKGDHTARAYVLTNGHCATTFGSNEVVVNQAAPASYRVTFGTFKDTPTSRREIAVRRVSFSTMKGTDLAILELDATLAELRDAGFRPLPLTRHFMTVDEPLAIVGAPAQGVAAPDLQLSACRLEASPAVVLEYQWHWFNFDRNRCAGIAPGSSGSPVISRLTGEVVGVVNTTTAGSPNDPAADCWLDRPCEATGRRALSLPAVNYALPTLGLVGCFDERGDFDITRDACPLDNGLQLSPIPAWLGYANPNLESAVIGQPRRRWDVRLSGPFARYRTRVVAAGDLESCREPGGYTEGRPLTANTLFDDPLPAAEGRYALCLLGEDGPSGPQSPHHPTVVTVAIDTTPPAGPAPFTVREGPSGWSVSWGSAPPEQSGVIFKFGASFDTRCSESSGYRPALVPFTTVPFASVEQHLCVIGLDSAGNQSPPVEQTLPPR